MKIFMTGATGYIGGAVASRLLASGHDVTALVRPQSDAEELQELGATTLSGDLASLPNRLDVLREHEVFIHTAVGSGERAVADDRTAIEAFLAVGRGHFIYTSGVWALGDTGSRVADESSPVNPLAVSAWRVPHEALVLSRNDDVLRTSVLRPGCVYGGKQSLLADWFAAVDQRQSIRIVGPGTNRWTLVDIEDLALCYLAALEGRASGMLHATDDSTETLNEMALAVARHAGTPTPLEHVSVADARSSMGPRAEALAANQRVSSARTRQALGWTPADTFSGSIKEQWSVWKSVQSLNTRPASD